MSKAARQRSARERLAEERKRQAERQRRIRASMISVAAVVVVALVVSIGYYFATKKDPNAPYAGPIATQTRRADGSILMGKQGANAPLLEVFEDFQCPICKEFEHASGGTVERLAAQGKVNVIYYPFWLFKQQPQPTSGNSQRAQNAALCAPAGTWVKYHDNLYKHQGEETSPGFANKDLIKWAKEVGINSPAFTQCVNGNQKQSQIDGLTNYVSQTRKVDSTPTVVLNGSQQLDLSGTLLKPKTLEKTITAAKPMPVPGQPTTPPASSPAPSSGK